MTSKQIKRRDFLKQASILLMGLFVLPVRQLFGIGDETQKKTNLPKEAKYYTTSDDLAG